MRSQNWHRASFPYNIRVHPTHTSSLPSLPSIFLPWASCRVCRPQRWRNGRFKATEIMTFTMVRAKSFYRFSLPSSENVRTEMRHVYAVSVVDGFNIPMMIIPSAGGCQNASCPTDLNPGCPSQLIGPRDSGGTAVGCKSACVAKLDNACSS
jgi:thaumatin family protein